MFYRQYTIVAWNIIKYNIFSDGRGPDLYGTEPWYYYILNGFLNFNIVFLLALGSAVCVVSTEDESNFLSDEMHNMNYIAYYCTYRSKPCTW